VPEQYWLGDGKGIQHIKSVPLISKASFMDQLEQENYEQLKLTNPGSPQVLSSS